jgi:acetoin utilization deacetylase AcuC-like enzyme
VSTPRLLLISDDAMLDHTPGSLHPERPERLRAVTDALREPDLPGAAWAAARGVTRDALDRVHAPAYVGRVLSCRGKPVSFDPDTVTSPGTVDAAELAAGATIDAVDAVLDGNADSAFALVRPPGHHAERDRAMGFCFFNNVAVAAAHAVEARGVERVLIFDWDVHHGNGTQHILETRADVLYMSLHQWPYYPGTGAPHEVGRDAGRGYNVNVPFPGGCGDPEYDAALERILLPIAQAYQPQLVLISAGFDANEGDPLASMSVTTNWFARATSRLLDVARESAAGRVVLALEGGYDLGNLAASCRACAEVLTEGCEVAGSKADAASPAGLSVLERVRREQRPFWGDAIG